MRICGSLIKKFIDVFSHDRAEDFTAIAQNDDLITKLENNILSGFNRPLSHPM
jgi:hypothetical protein